MKKLLFFLAIVGVIAVLLMITTPSRQQHVDTIKQVMTGVVNSELQSHQIDGALGSIASVASTNAIDQFLNTRFMVRDHRFYSIGFVDYDDQFIPVSFGILDHVYTLDEDMARQLVKSRVQEFLGM